MLVTRQQQWGTIGGGRVEKQVLDAARALVDANRGAKARTLDALDVLLPPQSALPANVRPFRRPGS